MFHFKAFVFKHAAVNRLAVVTIASGNITTLDPTVFYNPVDGTILIAKTTIVFSRT